MTASKTTRVLAIEGDLVRLQHTTVEREVRTSDFVREIARIHPLDTGILPGGCAWYARRENAGRGLVTVHAIERPPGMQAVRFNPDRGGPAGGEIETLNLSWPNTLWFVRCENDAILDVFLACTAAPLSEKGRDTKLFMLPMPNQYDQGNGAVCLGNLVVDGKQPLAARIDGLVRQILDSCWNHDLLPLFEDTGIEGLEDWAKRSAADPEFHGKMRFHEHRSRTAGQMMEFLLGTDG